MAIVRAKVKPQREQNAAKQVRELWWRFKRPAPELQDAITGMDRVLVTAAISSTIAFHFVPTGMVFSHKLIVFAMGAFSDLGVMQSSIHREWAYQYSSTMKTDLNYSPSDCFQTFPFPTDMTKLDGIGEWYYTHRQGIMQSRQEGLTRTYNRFHDPEESAEDIERLRELHAEMDEAVAGAYGWSDLDLAHGFHETKQGVRFTISEDARREVLDRLLLLNHERYAEEVEQGLHDKKTKKGKARKRTKPRADGGTSLFPDFGDEA